ncbi:MAG: hypothetical protein ACRD2G_12910, partial [Terriglobia bacterium]
GRPDCCIRLGRVTRPALARHGSNLFRGWRIVHRIFCDVCDQASTHKQEGIVAETCMVYKYYGSASNPSSCAAPPQGAYNNGDALSYFFQDNVNSVHTRTESFAYDAPDRLTNAVSDYNLTFSYDSYGNMTCQTNGRASRVAQPCCFRLRFVRGAI